MKNTILKVENLKKEFKVGKQIFTAVEQVNFELMSGEVLGIVGESGSGKSTVARMITHLIEPDGGQIYFQNQNITKLKRRKELIPIYREIQMIFQDAVGSFNPRMKVGQMIGESLFNLRNAKRADIKENVREILKMVGLKTEYADCYPDELSGGECQRAAIARALAVRPKLLICDEATSALDVLVQAEIVALLERFRKELNMSILFISHDLSLVSCFCDKICVLCSGVQLEMGESTEVISNPKTEYTKKLIASASNLCAY